MQIRPADWLTRARLETAAPTLWFHARVKLAQTLARGGFRLLGALADHARAAGWAVELVEYSREGADLALRQGGHLHVVMEDRPLYGPNIFNAVPGYLRGWWYFDDLGTRNNSSARLRRFDPRLVADGFAARFHARLADEFIGKNFSKFQQATRQSSSIEPGALALFGRFLRVYVWPLRRAVALCATLVCLEACSVYVLAWLTQVVVDDVLVVSPPPTAAYSSARAAVAPARVAGRPPAESGPPRLRDAPAGRERPAIGLGRRIDQGWSHTPRPAGAAGILLAIFLAYTGTIVGINLLMRFAARVRIRTGQAITADNGGTR